MLFQQPQQKLNSSSAATLGGDPVRGTLTQIVLLVIS
jgi:hypothetical protein